ncbi:hypothetical protein PBK173_000515300 [Plasmodium berghei]|uniref:Uncharacterized protein n=1 Tax=Plasmodium berghei TaxID=5821 RepID=A0A0Y9PRV3_PLABE|nr:hypothetical protein PBK173_000515300 [Plasmodium berghei]
MTIVDVVHTIS